MFWLKHVRHLIITAMADVPRDKLMAAHMIIRLDLDKYVYK